MDLRNVRTLGKGVMILTHGHKLSGAAKMAYIVYLSDKKIDDLDLELVKKGQEYASEILAKVA